MGVEFAQFVKTDIDFRYYQIIDEKRTLVYRGFLGLGIPYGNSSTGLPFIKKYFTGGANDIRAWQVRTIGPGTYSSDKVLNLIADMKITLNLEYRFPIISFLEGAMFIDAGNIWAIDKNDDRPGALFYWDSFYKQMAIGTGFGTRFDFSFFIIRFDFGIPLHDPRLPDGDRWFNSVKGLKFRDVTLNFGINYPF
jgi:outer membrane protein assembly factor BamA